MAWRHDALSLLALAGLATATCERSESQPPLSTPSPRRAVVRDAQPSLSSKVADKGRSYWVHAGGAERLRVGDHIDLLATVRDSKEKQNTTVTLLQNVIVLDRAKSRFALLVLPEEAELLALTAQIAALYVSRRDAKDVSVHEDRGRVLYRSLHHWDRRSRDVKTRRRGFQKGFARDKPPNGPVSGSRELCVPLAGADRVDAGDHLDVVVTVREPIQGSWIAITVLEDVITTGRIGSRCVALLVLPAEAERLVHAHRLGRLSASLRNPRDTWTMDEQRPTTREVVIYGEKIEGFHPHGRKTVEVIKIIRGIPGIAPEPRTRSKPPAGPRANPRAHPRPRPRPPLRPRAAP